MRPTQWLLATAAAFMGRRVARNGDRAGGRTDRADGVCRRHAGRAVQKDRPRCSRSQNAGVTVQAQFGGSVKMAKQITDLHQDADILAVADYNVIPKYMFAAPPHASWYAGIARNAITFVYTDKSKFAGEINADNWYKVLARPGVEIGRSNPDTDPSGYQTVQMLDLAEKDYKAPGLEAGRARQRAARPICATPRPR